MNQIDALSRDETGPTTTPVLVLHLQRTCCQALESGSADLESHVDIRRDRLTMIDRLFFIVLVLNTTGLFRFAAPLLGVSIEAVSLALLVLNVLYLIVKTKYSIPVLLGAGMAGWFIVLTLWPSITVFYAPAFQIREIGLVFYSFLLFFGTVVFTVANGLPAMHRVLTVSLGITFIGSTLSMLMPGYFEAVASLASARTEIMGRAYGFFMEPNNLAIGVALMFTGWFSLWRPKNSPFEVMAILAFLCLMLLSGSRTGMVLATVSVVCISTYSWSKRLRSARYVLTLSLLIVCLTVGIIGANYYVSTIGEASRRPGDLVDRVQPMLQFRFNLDGGLRDDQSLRERREAQVVYWTLIKEKPIAGYGLGTESHFLETGYILKSSHSDALTDALEYGVIYPFVLSILMLQLYRKRSRRDVERVFQSNSVFQFVFISLLLYVISGDMLEVRTFYVVWGMFFAAVYYPRHVFSYDGTGKKLTGYMEREDIRRAFRTRKRPVASKTKDRSQNDPLHRGEKLKVLQVVAALTAGGAEGFVTNLSIHLAEQGVDVRVFVLAGVRRERGRLLLTRLREAGVEVIGVEERKPASLANLLRLASLIRCWRPDVVHAHLYSTELACVCARVVSFGSYPRYVRTLHSTDIRGHLSPRVVRFLDRFFRLTIACSPAVADAYGAFMGRQMRRGVITIPNGAAMADWLPTAEEKRRTRNSLGISDSAFVVAHIGRMLGTSSGHGLASEPKAQDVLLRAFAKAFGGDENCTLLLVGDGPLRAEAEALSRELGLETQARFLGELSEPWPALKAADMFCFPSRFEGLPLALPEAASCGLPVVASNIPEIRSLCPGEAWDLVPVDDTDAFARAMCSVRANLKPLTLNAREVAEHFRDKYSMRTCAERYIREYAAILRLHTADNGIQRYDG